ncbi:MAG: hypothetical protein AAB316_15010 [Bacteroidota bacterium]
MVTRQEFKTISTLRIREAEVLFQSKYYDGACYLAGYSLETALKAAVCRNMNADNFFSLIKAESQRAFRIHNLEELVLLAGFNQRMITLRQNNPPLLNDWSFIVSAIKWSEQLRYEFGKTQSETIRMIEATKNILQWIKKYW